MESLCKIDFVKWYERARQIMKKKGISPKCIQEKLGEPQSNISRYLSGERSSDSIETALKFSKALEIPFMELVFGELQQELDPMLSKAKYVLDSGIPTISSALTWNIEAFSRAVELELDVKELKGEVAELKKYVTREVAETPVTSEPDQPPLAAPTSGPRRRITIPKTKAV